MSLAFDPLLHRYTLRGAVLPSVTQVLGPYESWGAVDPDVLLAARDRGQRVHAACSLVLQEQLDEESVDEEVAPYLAQFRRFLAESGFAVHLTEHRVWSECMGYAGTLDMFGDLPKAKSALVDIKSGSIPRTVGIQTAAYQSALEESTRARIKVRARYCLLLTTEAYRLVPLNDPKDAHVWRAMLTVHHWRSA